MKISPERLNAIHNMTKDLVGEQGAFILLLSKPDLEGEDIQLRIYGPDCRLTGLLSIGGKCVDDHLQKKLKELLIQRPAEPD